MAAARAKESQTPMSRQVVTVPPPPQKQQRQAQSAAAGAPAPQQTQARRSTATFIPYYTEAYNEIVEPRRFDHYLVRRWLPDLGPTGFLIVKVLRDRCFYNPNTGQLRDTCELSMDDLAALVHCSRAYLFKQFNENDALRAFVQRVEQYQIVDGKPRREKNRYRVSMDDPIHPGDMERYEELRALQEAKEHFALPGRIWKGRPGYESYESTGETHRANDSASYESTEKTHSAKNPVYESTTKTAETSSLTSTGCTAETSSLTSSAATAIQEDLPSGGSIPSDLFTPAAGRTPPQSDPPGGERHGGAVSEEGNAGETLQGDPLRRAWDKALRSLATQVNKPTFEAHLRNLCPSVWDEAAGEVEILCPSAFTREWIAKRHGDQIAALLAEALGRESITLRLTTPGK